MSTGHLVDLLLQVSTNKEGNKVFNSFVDIPDGYYGDCKEFAKVVNTARKQFAELDGKLDGNYDLPKDDVYEESGNDDSLRTKEEPKC